MGLVPTFFRITKQPLLPGYAYKISCCYLRARKFSAKSELEVNSADFEVGEMTKSSEKNNDHSFFEHRALWEFRVFSLSPGQVFLIGKFKKSSVPFCVRLTNNVKTKLKSLVFYLQIDSTYTCKPNFG